MSVQVTAWAAPSRTSNTGLRQPMTSGNGLTDGRENIDKLLLF